MKRDSETRELARSQLAGLTERDAALARAAELVFSGRSIRQAAAECGVPPTTVHEHVKRDERYIGRMEREALIAEAKAEAVEMRRQAARITLEGLNSGEIPTTQAPIVYGIAADKLVKLDQIEKPAPRDAMSDLLDRLGSEGGSIRLEVEPNRPAIDVTPKENE